MEWTPTEIFYYINNVLVHSQPNYNTYTPTGMRIRLQNMIQTANSTTPFPANFKVDYVRLYKSPSLWADMIQGPNETCIPTQNNTLNYYPDAYIPDANYSWTITNNATGSGIIDVSPGSDPAWGNVWANLVIKPTTPSANYNLRLIITLANGNVLPPINKTIQVFSTNPPGQPSTIQKTQYCDICTIKVNPITTCLPLI